MAITATLKKQKDAVGKGNALTLIRFDGVFRVAYVGYATLDDEHNSFARSFVRSLMLVDDGWSATSTDRLSGFASASSGIGCHPVFPVHLPLLRRRARNPPHFARS